MFLINKHSKPFDTITSIITQDSPNLTQIAFQIDLSISTLAFTLDLYFTLIITSLTPMTLQLTSM